MITQNQNEKFGGKTAVIFGPKHEAGCFVSTAKEGFFKKQSTRVYFTGGEHGRQPKLIAEFKYNPAIESEGRIQLHDAFVADIDKLMMNGYDAMTASLEILRAAETESLGVIQLSEISRAGNAETLHSLRELLANDGYESETSKIRKAEALGYRKSAEQGDATAQLNLGDAYSSGTGVTEDHVEAVKWWRKSAEQGNAEAQLSLGYAYFNGNGVTKDSVEAVKWWRKAAEQGNAKAQRSLATAYFNGEGVTKDSGEAVKWLRKSAEQGDATAQLSLGYAYFNGNGVTKDSVEAVKWWRKCAEQGYADAQYSLGRAYYNGEGVTKDSGEAYAWFVMADERGGCEKASEEVKKMTKEQVAAARKRAKELIAAIRK